MKSSLTKVLHPLCGVPMIRHCVASLGELWPDRLIIVGGRQKEDVAAEVAEYRPEIAVQDEPLGTGHAVMQAVPFLEGFAGDVLITPADAPLIRASTYSDLIEQRRTTDSAAALLAAVPEDPTGYGRIVRDGNGLVQRIVEHRDATDEERKTREINTSVYCFDSQALLDVLPRIGRDNAQREYYLPDAIGLLVADGRRVVCSVAPDADETRGINDRVQLAEAEAQLRQGIREELMAEGVTLVDPSSTCIDAGVTVGADTTVWPGALLTRGSTVGGGCTIGPSCLIRNSQIGSQCNIEHCAYVADSAVGDGAHVGPFASISGGAEVAPGARVDSFARVHGT